MMGARSAVSTGTPTGEALLVEDFEQGREAVAVADERARFAGLKERLAGSELQH
jgi:hypothetical protein